MRNSQEETMSLSMLERLAAALILYEGDPNHDVASFHPSAFAEVWGDTAPAQQARYARKARALLGALIEPTEAMRAEIEWMASDPDAPISPDGIWDCAIGAAIYDKTTLQRRAEKSPETYGAEPAF
jgi:hypothetical protein